MNKNKKELYEDNKKLTEQLQVYTDFWETDAIKICMKELNIIKKALIFISIVLLMLSMFLLGLTI